MASSTPSVFYGRWPWDRFRHWRFRRRLERILRDVPDDLLPVFNGNVALTETVYAPGLHALTVLDDGVEFHDACGCEKCHPELHGFAGDSNG